MQGGRDKGLFRSRGVWPYALHGLYKLKLQQQSFKSYTIGAIETRTVGDPFLVEQDGSVSKVKRSVGLLNSPDGCQVSDVFSEDYCLVISSYNFDGEFLESN